MEMLVWNIVLTGLIAALGWMMQDKFAEIKRLGILLNRTREEGARDHITRAAVREDMRQLLDRLERLDQKIDKLIANHAQ